MTRCIRIHRQEGGSLSISGAAEEECWEDVLAEAMSWEREGDMEGWDKWNALWRVVRYHDGLGGREVAQP